MSATNFNTKNDTYRKLMGSGLTYRIPRFQRDYSWGEDHWDDLWQDITNTVKDGGEPAHYMGYLVLQSSDDKMFDIIDGQQRLTTLSVLVLAALRNLNKLIDEGNEVEKTSQRLEGLRQTYVGYVDPVTLVARSKLTLNRNNDHYYQTYLVPLREQLPQRGFKSSEHGLRKAFQWYEKKIQEYAKGLNDPGLAIAQLIEAMSDKLFFTVITVTDELNAYIVFETLNARGVRLSSTDLLKNYLFSVLHREGQHEHEMKSLDDRWEQIVGRLGAESFPDFLRVHWISRRSFVRQSELFKTIRNQIRNKGDVFRLLSEIEEDVDTYLALTSPDASDWSPKCKEYARLLRMFSVRQPFSLLMVAKRKIQTVDFESLLRAIVVISFRYNVIGNYQTSEQERTYYAEASKISKGEHTCLSEVLDGLKSVYPNDEVFCAAFTEKTVGITQNRNRRIVRYILAQLEHQKSGTDVDFDSDKLSIEHICPLNPSDNTWPEFTDEDVEAFSSRLGNLTLMSDGANKRAGNEGYATKRLEYESSPYQITKEVAEQNATWTPERIDVRQKAMAKTATAIWRISQYE